MKEHIRRLSDLECDEIVTALYVTRGHVSEAARALGIGRATLYRKLREYEIGFVLQTARDLSPREVNTILAETVRQISVRTDNFLYDINSAQPALDERTPSKIA